MAYEPNRWGNDDPDTPLSAERLNKIETGIQNAHTLADSTIQGIDALEGRISVLEERPAPPGGGVSESKVTELIDAALTRVQAPGVDQEQLRLMVRQAVEALPAATVDEQAIAQAVRQAVEALPAAEASSINIAEFVSSPTDTAGLLRAIDAAKTQKKPLVLPAHATLELSTVVDATGVLDVQFFGDVTATATGTLVVGHDSRQRPGQRIFIKSALHKAQEQTNTTVRVQGTKQASIEVRKCSSLELLSTAEPASNSIAYCAVTLGQIKSLVINASAAGGWITETQFNGGDIAALTVKGAGNINGLTFVKPSLEGALVDFQTGSRIIMREVRSERMRGVKFGVGTSNILIEDAYTSNPNQTGSAINVLADEGVGNRVVSIWEQGLSSLEIRRVQPAGEVKPWVYPLQDVEVPVRGTTTDNLGARRAWAVQSFLVESDQKAWRPEVQLLDGQGTVVENPEGLDLSGGWRWDAAGKKFTFQANTASARIVVKDPAAERAKIGVRNGNANTTFTTLVLSVFASPDALKAFTTTAGIADPVSAEIARQIAKLPPAAQVSPDALSTAVAEYLRDNPPAAADEGAIRAAVSTAIANNLAATITSEVEKQIANQLAVGDAAVARPKPSEGADITTALQAAINDPTKSVIELPAGQWEISNTITLDKLSGKVLKGAGEATILRMKRGTNKNALQSTSGGKLKGAVLTGFVVDMDWQEGTPGTTAVQITNAADVVIKEVTAKNCGGNGFLLQGFTTKEKATGNGTVDSRVINCVVNGAGLLQKPADQGASGFGILVKDESLRCQIVGNTVRGVSCGMGIGGTDSLDEKLPANQRQGAPKDTLVSNNVVVMAENQTIAYEPIGFTKPSIRTNIVGNVLPESKDNGISVGAQSVVSANVIGETWNHGIACSGHGTKIIGNEIQNVGKENSTRLRSDPKEWAAVALEDPVGCVVQANTYAQSDVDASCDFMIKVVLRKGTPKSAVGGNYFIGNAAQEGTVKKAFFMNANINPDRPDVVITAEEMAALQKALLAAPAPDPLRWFDPTRRYFTPVTYWWADQHEADSKWNTLWGQAADIWPFAIINPRSGPGDQKEQAFVDLVKKVKAFKKPSVGYVKTTATFTPSRVLRSKEEILADCKKHVDWYQVDGIFLDEMINGWSAAERELVPFYQELYRELKQLYGQEFLIIGNPGTNTVEGMLSAADILMSFEKAATDYLNDRQSPVTPDHYRKHLPTRFIHVIHNIEGEQQARQVLEKAETSNVAFVYLTDDTFSGVIGSESETNNPWDSVPAAWLLKMQGDWCRRALLPQSLRSYQTPQ